MKRFLSYFSPKAPAAMVYMLQQFEYSSAKFVVWFCRLPNLSVVQKRGKLSFTKRSYLLLAIAYFAWLVVLLGSMSLYVMSKNPVYLLGYLLSLVLVFMVLTMCNGLLEVVIVKPLQRQEIKHAREKLNTMPATKIAVLGSYGKTSMKELLMTVLSQGKKVAATPGNKNILVSHARWVNKQLTGDEEVLIFEYGEAAPGDIAAFAAFSQPEYAVVTGLAPAHLDAYPSLEAVADDFAAIKNVVAPAKTFVHADSELLKQKMSGSIFYSSQGIGDWQVSDVKVDYDGTKFTLVGGTSQLKLKTGLLGKHQVGPISAVAVLAKDLGLSDTQIVDGVMATQAYEHRMQARSLHGAWIIDDTYNGNIEGMRAGLELLKLLPGKKKIYVTPGLVDQGIENERVHNELGTLIAQAKPEKVVLMQNSNTSFITAGLEAAGYSGELVTEGNPLDYYTNLEHFLAAGDVVMMQNDLPDSYK